MILKKIGNWSRKKIILAKVFCVCDDHRTENIILIIWHDWPELLPGQVERGTCRKQSSHVAKRLGKEMLAEGGSPWDRTDDNRNRNVSYFQGTVAEEACATRGYGQVYLHVLQESCIKQQARETKTGTKEHRKRA